MNIETHECYGCEHMQIPKRNAGQDAMENSGTSRPFECANPDVECPATVTVSILRNPEHANDTVHINGKDIPVFLQFEGMCAAKDA